MVTPPAPKTPAGEALSDARAREVLADLLGYRKGSAQRVSFLDGNMIPIVFPSDAIAAMLAYAKEATPPASDAPASGAGLDWLHIAKTAGKYGIRYPTNWRLEAFLNEVATAPKVPSDTPASGAGEALLAREIAAQFYDKRDPLDPTYRDIAHSIRRGRLDDQDAVELVRFALAYPATAPKVASDTGAGLRTMLQEAHDTLHECTAVLRADDCRKVAAVMERIRDVLATPTDATDGATVASEAAGLREAAVLRSAVRRILARCEAVEDENSDQLEKEQTEASSGFLRGERSLAKSLRRELHDLNREALGTISPDLEVWISGNAGRAEAVKHGADTYGDDDLAEGSAA